MLGLFHGNLVDVRKRLRARGALDGPNRDFLHLLLGVVHLLLQVRNLRVLPRDQIFQRLDLQFGYAPVRFCLFLQQQRLLVCLLLRLFGRQRGGLLHFTLQASGKISRLLPQT